MQRWGCFTAEMRKRPIDYRAIEDKTGEST